MSEWSPLSRVCIIAGLVLLGFGVLVQVGPRLPWLGRLPGDILVQRERVTFYFPLATSLLISGLVSLLLWLWNRFRP